MASSPVRKIPSRLQADVVVVGSGLAGVSAAIQAARLGCTVILLEKDEVFGGNSGPNLGIHISGAHSFHPYASETGIVNELEEEASFRSAKTYSYRYHYNISRLWDSLLEEYMRTSGVLCLRRSYAKRAVTRDGRIEAVVFEDLATYRTRRVEVKVCVVDASGDGQIAYTAGADFDYGREARSEFGERSAPEKRDRKVMGTSLTALVRKTQRAVKFHPPPGTPPFEPGYGYGRDKVSKDCLLDHSSWNPDADLCFLWHTETGGDMDTIEDEHEIYERLLLQLYSVWNHIKNEAHQRESLNWELLWVSPKAGKRESRRFIGDYVLTQTDVEEGRRFADAVAYGGYAVDVHEPRGVQAKVIFHSIPPLYDIPYRSLYSRNVDNLLLAGRLVSVTHLALGTVRLQKTLAAAGQAVGVAAALCKRYGCTPRQIWQEHMEELQQLLLREDATIIGVTNRDPGDLARGARVEATSEELFHCTELDGWLPLDVDRGIMLWDWPTRLRRVELYLANEANRAVDADLVVRLCRPKRKWRRPDESSRPGHVSGPSNRFEWGGNGDPEIFEEVARVSCTVEDGFEGWKRFVFEPVLCLPQKDPTSDEERLLLQLLRSDGLKWGVGNRMVEFGARARLEDDGWKTEPGLHLFQIEDRPAYGEAPNVVNGYNRRFSTCPTNMWISRPEDGLPQSLTLNLASPGVIREIHSTFDTLYRSYLEMPFNDPDREVSGMCVKDFDLEVWDGSHWTMVASVRENHHRRVVCRFPDTRGSKVRLTVLSTWEDGYPARVYEVRVYGNRAG